MSEFRNYNQEYFPHTTRVHKLKVKRTRKGRIFIAAVTLLTLLGAILYGAFVYADEAWVYLAHKYFGKRINTVTGSELPPAGDKLWLNIMLLGVDQRNNEPSRSDTLMVAMLNLKDKSVYVISIPRDTRVKIEGVKYKTKINHAHSMGGVDLTRKTVEEFLGIPIHNYIETNFDGFKNIIDELGGVTIDVEKRMYYPAEGINLRKGVQHLDGKDALAYVRFRSDGGGDLPRIQRQHKFLKATADQILQPKTLLKIPGIAGELHSNINTDMSVKDMLVLAGEFKNVKSENIRFADIPGTPKYVNGASYYVVEEDELKAFLNAILEGKDPKNLPDEDKRSEESTNKERTSNKEETKARQVKRTTKASTESSKKSTEQSQRRSSAKNAETTLDRQPVKSDSSQASQGSDSDNQESTQDSSLNDSDTNESRSDVGFNEGNSGDNASDVINEETEYRSSPDSIQ